MSISFLIGTCRVHEPAVHMRRHGQKSLIIPSRVHTPFQVLQILRFLNGENIYAPNNIHLLSDYALDRLIKDEWTPQMVHNELCAKRDGWAGCDTVFIEISTLKEHFIERDKSRPPFYVNTFTANGLQSYATEMEKLYSCFLLNRVLPQDIQQVTLSKSDLRKVMGKIRSIANQKRIVWVSHVRPQISSAVSDDLIRSRQRLSSWLSEISGEFGDNFYDPIVAIAELGDEKFFRNSGLDINHMTEDGAMLISKHFINILDNNRV